MGAFPERLGKALGASSSQSVIRLSPDRPAMQSPGSRLSLSTTTMMDFGAQQRRVAFGHLAPCFPLCTQNAREY